MKNIYTMLQDCPLFDGIRPEDLPGMIGCLGAKKLNMKKGQSIFREGDPSVYMGIVLSGAIQLIREDFYGNRSVVARIGAMQLFGESYAFSEAETLPVSIVPDEDGEILLMDSRRITRCCSNVCEFHNRLIFNLLRLVAEKNLLLHQKIDITAKRSTREKLMAYLMQQAKLHGSNTFTIPFDRQSLADYLEVDRSGLSSEIGKLRREGVLECEKGTFRLL